MLDYRIETFLVLCKIMNYRKTAETLNMTQPAVTKHIQSLEEHYGCRLFEYDHHRLRMTPEAEILRQAAENMQYQERCLEERMRSNELKILQIGATKTIGEFVIGPDIASFLSVPNHRISVEVDNTEILLRKLSDGLLDFALIEGNFDRQEYASSLYRSEPFVGLCSIHHPFAGKSVSLEELLQEPLLLREEGSGTRRIFESMLWKYNLTPAAFPRITCISNFGLMTNLIELNCGVTFAYEAVQKRNPKLAVFHLEGIHLEHDFSYVYLNNPEAEAAVKLFETFRRFD